VIDPVKTPPPIPEKLPEKSPEIATARLVETEHLPAIAGKPRGELPDLAQLQSLFMTDEDLTLDRVIDLCSELPGISACILAHGDGVISSAKVPDHIDIVSLSAHAVEMLRNMRSSSAKMGLGSIPAVTIHSEKGLISFFHHDQLCLLVMHKDRGFIPGVREKLSATLAGLASAPLPRGLPTAGTPEGGVAGSGPMA